MAEIAIDMYLAGYKAGKEEATTKWISVKERLPREEECVLLCVFGRSVGEGVYRGYDGHHRVWKMYAVSGTYWDDEVTHWMQLPEPPEEGGGEDG